MSKPARVLSFDALRDFQGHLADFGLKADAALCSADHEVRHTVDWLHDQLKFWQQAAEKCQEEVNRARAELSIRRIATRGKISGTTEQEIAVMKAQQRLKHVEEKINNTKRWLRQLPEILKRFQGPARQLSGIVGADLKQAIALLGRKVAALQAYAETTAPTAKEQP